jgi:hypothetical protein
VTQATPSNLGSYDWHTCAVKVQDSVCKLVPTKNGTAACRYIYDRYDCQLVDKYGRVVWLMLPPLAGAVSATAVYDGMVYRPAKDILLSKYVTTNGQVVTE